MNVYEEIKQLEIENAKIRSKSMFNGDFIGEIDQLIKKLEEEYSKRILKNYKIEYSSYWANSAKVKITDPEKVIFKLIHCKLTYKKNDIKFWYIHPEIISDEKWQKTVTYKLWKFTITDHDKIIKAVLEKTIEAIDEY